MLIHIFSNSDQVTDLNSLQIFMKVLIYTQARVRGFTYRRINVKLCTSDRNELFCPEMIQREHICIRQVFMTHDIA